MAGATGLKGQPGSIKQVELTDSDLQSYSLIEETREEISTENYKSSLVIS